MYPFFTSLIVNEIPFNHHVLQFEIVENVENSKNHAEQKKSENIDVLPKEEKDKEGNEAEHYKEHDQKVNQSFMLEEPDLFQVKTQEVFIE